MESSLGSTDSTGSTGSTDRQSLIENLDLYLVDNMPVVDADGYNVGPIKRFSIAAGYLMVGHGAFDQADLYIPFRLIRGISPDEVFISEPRGVLASRFTQPPAIRTRTEERLVPGPNGTPTAQAQDVQSVESGYDGQPVTLNRVDVADVAAHLAVGMVVYDIAGSRVGEITHYDVPRRLLVVERGLLKPKALYVPFSAIRAVNMDDLTVFLTLPRDILVKENAMQPGEA
jgi:hypothetical protein